MFSFSGDWDVHWGYDWILTHGRIVSEEVASLKRPQVQARGHVQGLCTHRGRGWDHIVLFAGVDYPARFDPPETWSWGGLGPLR